MNLQKTVSDSINKPHTQNLLNIIAMRKNKKHSIYTYCQEIIKRIGLNNYLAVKASWNRSYESNETFKNQFYDMVKRRSKYKDAAELAVDFNRELLYHTKEFAQFK